MTKVCLLLDEHGTQLETFSLGEHLVFMLRTDIVAALFRLKYGESIQCLGYNQKLYTIVVVGSVENKTPGV